MTQSLAVALSGVLLLFLDYAPTNGSSYYVLIEAGEYVGGPECCKYDNPFATASANGIVHGYTANGNTYLIVNGTDVNQVLAQALDTGLDKDSSTDSLDHCGAWLNSVHYDGHVFRGFYHEEWRCDYAKNFYTNKSIAYAESEDGVHFTKPGHPHNVIISAPNTTTGHQTGQGDHGSVVVEDFYYLYYRDWATWRIGLARSPVSSGGKPGTWMKYYNNEFSEPGIRGQSSGIGAGNLTGTAVYRLSTLGALVAVGEGSPTLSFSPDGLRWLRMKMPLIHTDESQWNRTLAKGDLVAYPALISDGNDLTNHFYLYYTYLEPRDTFAHRYLARKRVYLNMNASNVNDDFFSLPVLGALAVWYNDKDNDTWATSAMVPHQSGYSVKNRSVAYLATAKIEQNTLSVFECYNNDTRDHFLTVDTANCTKKSQMLRTAGWSWSAKPTLRIPNMTPLVMIICYDAVRQDHDVVLERECQTGYHAVEALGFVLVRNSRDFHTQL